MQKSVLVHVVEPRKEGQVRLRRAFSVLKGLDRLDCCPIIRAYAADRSPPPALIPLPAYVDGELGATGGTAASELNELPDEIVKRGPQVVAALADDDPETGIGQLPFEAKDVLAGIALEVSNDSAVFLAKEGVPFTIERGQVLVRAFDSPINGF